MCHHQPHESACRATPASPDIYHNALCHAEAPGEVLQAAPDKLAHHLEVLFGVELNDGCRSGRSSERRRSNIAVFASVPLRVDRACQLLAEQAPLQQRLHVASPISDDHHEDFGVHDAINHTKMAE